MVFPLGEELHHNDQLKSTCSYIQVVWMQVHFCGEMCESVQKSCIWKGKRNKSIPKREREFQPLQSLLVCAYRDYNVISGVSVWCQVEVRVYDKKVPGVRMAVAAGNINCVWPILGDDDSVWHTHTHSRQFGFSMSLEASQMTCFYIRQPPTWHTLRKKSDVDGEKERQVEVKIKRIKTEIIQGKTKQKVKNGSYTDLKHKKNKNAESQTTLGFK